MNVAWPSQKGHVLKASATLFATRHATSGVPRASASSNVASKRRRHQRNGHFKASTWSSEPFPAAKRPVAHCTLWLASHLDGPLRALQLRAAATELATAATRAREVVLAVMCPIAFLRLAMPERKLLTGVPLQA